MEAGGLMVGGSNAHADLPRKVAVHLAQRQLRGRLSALKQGMKRRRHMQQHISHNLEVVLEIVAKHAARSPVEHTMVEQMKLILWTLTGEQRGSDRHLQRVIKRLAQAGLARPPPIEVIEVQVTAEAILRPLECECTRLALQKEEFCDLAGMMTTSLGKEDGASLLTLAFSTWLQRWHPAAPTPPAPLPPTTGAPMAIPPQ